MNEYDENDFYESDADEFDPEPYEITHFDLLYDVYLHIKHSFPYMINNMTLTQFTEFILNCHSDLNYTKNNDRNFIRWFKKYETEMLSILYELRKIVPASTNLYENIKSFFYIYSSRFYCKC